MYNPRMFNAEQRVPDLLKDIAKLIREALAVFNDFVGWQFIESIIGTLDNFINANCNCSNNP